MPPREEPRPTRAPHDRLRRPLLVPRPSAGDQHDSGSGVAASARSAGQTDPGRRAPDPLPRTCCGEHDLAVLVGCTPSGDVTPSYELTANTYLPSDRYCSGHGDERVVDGAGPAGRRDEDVGAVRHDREQLLQVASRTGTTLSPPPLCPASTMTTSGVSMIADQMSILPHRPESVPRNDVGGLRFAQFVGFPSPMQAPAVRLVLVVLAGTPGRRGGLGPDRDLFAGAAYRRAPTGLNW